MSDIFPRGARRMIIGVALANFATFIAAVAAVAYAVKWVIS